MPPPEPTPAASTAALGSARQRYAASACPAEGPAAAPAKAAPHSRWRGGFGGVAAAAGEWRAYGSPEYRTAGRRDDTAGWSIASMRRGGLGCLGRDGCSDMEASRAGLRHAWSGFRGGMGPLRSGLGQSNTTHTHTTQVQGTESRAPVSHSSHNDGVMGGFNTYRVGTSPCSPLLGDPNVGADCERPRTYRAPDGAGLRTERWLLVGGSPP